MVVIRLSRGGAKKRPFYHIVVTDSRKPRDSGFIERVGYFNPLAKGGETRLHLDRMRVDHWLKQGIRPSSRVALLIKAFDQGETSSPSAPAAPAESAAPAASGE